MTLGLRQGYKYWHDQPFVLQILLPRALSSATSPIASTETTAAGLHNLPAKKHKLDLAGLSHVGSEQQRSIDRPKSYIVFDLFVFIYTLISCWPIHI